MTESPSNRLVVGCGYLGLRVARSWQTSGYSTHAVTRSAERASLFEQEGLRPVILDLANPPDSFSLPPADVILWAVGFDRSAGVSRESVWLDGLRWLTSHLTVAPSKFIYVSSTSVYGAGNGESVDEESPVNPETEGGQGCVQAETLLRKTLAAQFPITRLTVLRLAGIYGPDRLLRKVADLRSGTPMPGDPDAWLNLIHVDDAVRTVNAVCQSADPPDIVNVVSRETVTRRQYYESLAQFVDAPPPTFGTSNRGLASRGGNKRVVSVRRSDLDVTFQFENPIDGVKAAVEATRDL